MAHQQPPPHQQFAAPAPFNQANGNAAAPAWAAEFANMNLGQGSATSPSQFSSPAHAPQAPYMNQSFGPRLGFGSHFNNAASMPHGQVSSFTQPLDQPQAQHAREDEQVTAAFDAEFAAHDEYQAAQENETQDRET